MFRLKIKILLTHPPLRLMFELDRQQLPAVLRWTDRRIAGINQTQREKMLKKSAKIIDECV